MTHRWSMARSASCRNSARGQALSGLQNPARPSAPTHGVNNAILRCIFDHR
ncbi:hypothetical protein JYU34_005221 [Plutella xylostella]|uniref:DUF1534 domain-containing protein n=1 Tax=Plutella xylostella TaxID=51655 RepID=A0ABQ7QW63_PLUXY|nr:hypothetical protein JYU34_005221 [Plutella xylostella]